MNARKFRNWIEEKNPLITRRTSATIQKVLDGDYGLLMESFCWSEMPQGVCFWQRRFRGAKLSKRTRQFLAKLREEAKRRGC